MGCLHDFPERCCPRLVYAARLLQPPSLLKLSCTDSCCYIYSCWSQQSIACTAQLTITTRVKGMLLRDMPMVAAAALCLKQAAGATATSCC